MASTDQVKDEIRKAIGAHGLWKVRLRSAIDSGNSEFEVETVRSPHNCDFGKWLDKEKEVLSKFEFFERVSQFHEEVHSCTADIMEKAFSKKKQEAEAMLEGEFSEVSTKLVKELMKWNTSLA